MNGRRLYQLLSSAVLPLVLCGEVNAAGGDGCRVLSERDESALLTYSFEATVDELDALPAGVSYELGVIRLVGQPIFEKQNNRLQQLANRYHVNTRETTIRAALIVAQGDVVNRKILEEAERALRRKPYLYDARIIARRICGERLDIDVVIRDVWTLMPTLTLERAGGESSSGIGLEDSNWFGRGKAFGIQYLADNDRDGVGGFFSDPNIMGSRWALSMAAFDNDDGHRYVVGAGMPFYALDVRRAYGLRAVDYARDEGLYSLNEKRWEFHADSQFLDVNVGFSGGLRDDVVTRWFVGLAYDVDEFEFPAAFPFTRPEDRKELYPFVGFQRIEDRFGKRKNVQRVLRTEDLNVGLRMNARLGWSSEHWGARGERLIVSAGFANAQWLSANQLLSYASSINGDYDLDEARIEDLFATASVSYTFNHAERFAFSAKASFSLANNLPVDKQLLLGGDVGVRGYPSRFQSGDRRFLVTLEERYYSSRYPFQMFRWGLAAFLDVGRAWYEDEVPDWLSEDRQARHFGILSNIGVGLRIESTRTRRDLLLHLDFAVPMVDGPNVSGVEITFTAKRSL